MCTVTPIGTASVSWSDGVCVVLPRWWNETSGTATPMWPPTMRGAGASGVVTGGGIVAIGGGGATAGGGAVASWAAAGAAMNMASATSPTPTRSGSRRVLLDFDSHAMVSWAVAMVRSPFRVGGWGEVLHSARAVAGRAVGGDGLGQVGGR